MSSGQKKRLGELLLEAGIIDATQLAAALGHQRQWGCRLGQALVDMKLATEPEVTQALAYKFGYEVARLEGLEAYALEQALKLVPREFAVRNNVFPMAADTSSITVAMSDPTNLAVVDELRFRTGRKVNVCIGGDRELAAAVKAHYAGGGAVEAIALDLDVDDVSSSVLDPFGGGSESDYDAFFGNAAHAGPHRLPEPPGAPVGPGVPGVPVMASGPSALPPPPDVPIANGPPVAPAEPIPVAPRVARPSTAAGVPAVRPAAPAPAAGPPAPVARPPTPAAPPAAPRPTVSGPAAGAGQPPAPRPAPRAPMPMPMPAPAPAPAPGPAPAATPALGRGAPGPVARPAPAPTPPPMVPAPPLAAPFQERRAPAPVADLLGVVTKGGFSGEEPELTPLVEEEELPVEPLLTPMPLPLEAAPLAPVSPAAAAPLPAPAPPFAAAGPLPGPAPSFAPAGALPGPAAVAPQPVPGSPGRGQREAEILASLERLAGGAPAEPDIVRPAQAIAALIQVLLRKGVISEDELLDVLLGR